MDNLVTNKNNNNLRWLKTGVFISLITSLIVVLIAVDNLLLSFVLAFVISFLVGPIVNFLERAGIHRLSSTLFVFAIFTLLVAVGITSIIPVISKQFSTLQAQIPSYIDGTGKLITDFERKIEELTGFVYQGSLGGDFEGLMVSWTKSIFEDLPTFISKLGATLILAPFFAFFLVKDGRGFSKSFLSIVPNHLFELTLNMYYQINTQMGQFVRARILEAFIVGLVVWLGLWLINFPFASILAIFAGVTNLIPYLGPIIGSIPAVLIALISGHAPFDIFLVCLVYGIAQLIDTVFIIPLVVAKLVNLHPITVVVVIIIGAQLLGILGMIISIPVASALKVTFTNVYRHLVEFRV